MSLTINLIKGRITDISAGITQRERQVANVTILSYFDTVATENMQMILINHHATIP